MTTEQPSHIKTLEQVINAVTIYPVSFDVKIEPLSRWQAILQKLRIQGRTRTLTIEPVTAGTLYRISKLLLTIDENLFDKGKLLDNAYQLSVKYHRTLSEVIATAIHNKRTPVPPSLVELIEEQFTPQALLKVIVIVLRQMDIQSFILSIASIRGLSIVENPVASAQSADPSEASPLTR